MKILPFLALLAMPFAGYTQQKVFNITAYGAKADGITNNAISIQKAIDDANAQGGGTVYIPAGKFLTGVISLRSNVTLNLAANAVLLGSAKRIDYGEGHASPLIVAKDVQHIGITGKGTIDGNGDELLKDVFAMLKAGKLRDSLWQKENPWGQTQPEEPNRPKLIGFFNCAGIVIKGVTMKNGLVWVQDYRQCRDMVIDSIKVESNTYWNNDGIDLVDCKNVKLTNSFFNADDDGICLKSSDRNSSCENIYVANCTIRSSASGIKLGTASWGGFKKITIKDVKIYDTYRSAIALECVDGGVMEDIDISNIQAVNTGNAIFIRLGHRNKDAVVSSINGVRISNVTVDVPKGKPDKGYPMEGPEVKGNHNIFPSSIAGLPGHPVKNVTLQNIKIVYHGDASKTVAHVSLDSLASIPENPHDYPEFSMFGELPAWGFYARHVVGVTFKNVTLSCPGTDFRAACVFHDVDGLTVDGLKIPQVKSLPVVVLHGITRLSLKNIQIPGKSKNKIRTR
ncbi:glycoside hydrolase family 28 protein [Mucilaginibacter sp. FT3.2]|uniref:glycoside hydrolase family 28 protein n=1 Tax=Mucilaginibacter sp. FT3.2 TaxID=2723090 RepID=UPI0016117D8D|nr:glycosyl hydrolase family 28 protein [Mucilaginibacter sp. FT3.2]MBB6230396.1 polygalacturonase [Mucilaginibacter sp. FT3.2]